MEVFGVPVKTSIRRSLIEKMLDEGQLGEVVEDQEGEERDDQEKSRLINALLDGNVDLAPNDALNEQKKNHAAIEDRKGQQVDDAQIEADLAGKIELVIPAFALGGVSGGAGNAQRSGQGAGGRNFARGDPLEHLQQ